MQTDQPPQLTQSTLRDARKAAGLSLRAAAARSGIDPGHLSKVERGEKQLSIESLYRLAVALELTELADLLRPHTSRQASA